MKLFDQNAVNAKIDTMKSIASQLTVTNVEQRDLRKKALQLALMLPTDGIESDDAGQLRDLITRLLQNPVVQQIAHDALDAALAYLADILTPPTVS